MNEIMEKRKNFIIPRKKYKKSLKKGANLKWDRKLVGGHIFQKHISQFKLENSFLNFPHFPTKICSENSDFKRKKARYCNYFLCERVQKWER